MFAHRRAKKIITSGKDKVSLRFEEPEKKGKLALHRIYEAKIDLLPEFDPDNNLYVEKFRQFF